MELQDRVAVVTGASRGIGREIALGYARAGAHVVLCARATAHLQAVASEIDQAGGACSVQPLDVTDHAAVRTLFDGVVREHGRIDVLCNNAGVSSARGSVRVVAFSLPRSSVASASSSTSATSPHMALQQ